ncbi:hypothetical protein H310_14099 [Aphanomyces invadans]|uniref:C2 domain-containing protein n=1 Tax=Aphanomyces invadans TaxID=157072 RepID=A0A024TCB1_9STRA|nr:hypothetical protein H310_14099 [Aphanomyces invadans]ETV91236.1 hypothetical protein H310_14099 [Aphanomyces invadans]|eukprot:XP_008880073.1 hypothetical protein H310_14099 [Aphanomyces invadans]
MADNAVDEAATCIQKLFRQRAAKKRMVQLASSVYRKCYDSNTGLAYYCNLKTGETAWDRPKIFGSDDAPDYDANPTVVGDAVVADDKQIADSGGVMADSTVDEAISTEGSTLQVDTEAEAKIELAKLEGLELVQRQAQVKADLERQNRKQVHRGRKNWEKRMRLEQQAHRAARLQQIAGANKQAIQDLLDGKSKPELESIREACMRGHLDRVASLLDEGWSPNAESAMGLTPLLAACLGGHVHVVQLLLRRHADVNHRHIVTQRTAYMEACQRPNVPVVRELLRHGARIHWTDKQGRVARDGITHKKVMALHEAACGVWSPHAASVFPNNFRAATVTLAFVAKCQRVASAGAKARALKAAAATRVDLQKNLIQAKVQYDHDMKESQMQFSQAKRRDLTTAADERYDSTRASILQAAEAASVALHRDCQPRWLEEANVVTILAFCSRHWFDEKATSRSVPHDANGNASIDRHVVPTKRWISSSQVVPDALRVALMENSAAIQEMSAEVQLLEATQTTDVDAGVLVLATTKQSQATVDVTIVEAQHLAKRSNRSLIDPLVRVRVHGEDGGGVGPPLATEPRMDDENPIWDHRMTFHHVPSIRCELHVQIIDTAMAKGGTHHHHQPELAGEIRLPLRKYIDQKDHDEWHVVPQTLKQALVEAKSREVPARLHLVIRFTHAKTLVLTRELARAAKLRQDLLAQRRAFVQKQIARVLAVLDTKPHSTTKTNP